MKNKKILPMPVLILIAAILGTAVLGEGGYIAAKKIEKYKDKIILQENILKYALDALSAQQKELEKIKEDLNIAQKGLDKKKSAAVESARKAQEESAQNKISALEEKISQTKTYSLSSIISDWRPLIANVECQFRYSDTGRLYQKSSGSGIAIKFENTPSAILTNKHVLTDSNGYGADSCSAKLLDSDETLSSSDIRSSAKEYDLGYIYINNPSDYFKNLTSNFPALCSQKPSLGDEIVVLGYPSIGSKNGLTATEGIVSGFDGNHFITSAKVEQGNSGGAAILLKDNCLLGIPTFVTLGKVESLARILDIWTAVEK
ncbi:MAG: hypothetical protein A2W59_01485 [Candidatus Terrybacteria bacterium RIFCSPHIGHO2_02_41_19]|uniref:Serine protease n=1 Tax=Candidatus Terrybacteria bacterium RIFCSPHIGHO2_02_41_19 TaxID=1802364 RepID=A0A1G2PQQ4_9BACT|nr:MAG: hypothetical protein A2W59_01485 [Candidatus Terrybacteria bacterium RIFCSPHIGHO2_02_41_19]